MCGVAIATATVARRQFVQPESIPRSASHSRRSMTYAVYLYCRTLEINACGLGTLPESFSQLQKLESFTFLESPQDCSGLSSLTALTHLVVATQNSRACSKIPNLKGLVIETMPTCEVPRQVMLVTIRSDIYCCRAWTQATP